MTKPRKISHVLAGADGIAMGNASGEDKRQANAASKEMAP